MARPTPNDPDASFVTLLTASQLSLLLYVRSLMPGDPAAQDVAQQANATIWEKRAEFELGTNFKAWAFSIARYEVLNRRKQQSRDARLVFSEDLERTIAVELAEAPDEIQRRQEASGVASRSFAPRIANCCSTGTPVARPWRNTRGWSDGAWGA